MGKKKGAKSSSASSGGGKASSSARAAELLQQQLSSGQTPVGANVFGTAAAQGHSFVASALHTHAHTQSTGHLSSKSLPEGAMLAIQATRKRDKTTRTKALQSLLSIVTEANQEQTQELLAHIPRIYVRLSMDSSRQVRQLIQQVWAQICKAHNRLIAPHLNTVFGHWLCAQHDLERDIAATAYEAFKAAFPEHKREKVFLVCQDSTVEFMRTNIMDLTVGMLSETNSAGDDDFELANKHERIVGSSLFALGRILPVIAKLNQANQDKIREMLTSSKLWKQHKHPGSFVRAGLCQLAQSAMRYQADLLAEDSKARPIAAIIACLADDAFYVAEAALNSLIVACQYLPEAFDKINPEKAFQPKLFGLVSGRSAWTPALSSAVFAALPPLVEQLPKTAIGDNMERFSARLITALFEVTPRVQHDKQLQGRWASCLQGSVAACLSRSDESSATSAVQEMVKSLLLGCLTRRAIPLQEQLVRAVAQSMLVSLAKSSSVDFAAAFSIVSDRCQQTLRNKEDPASGLDKSAITANDITHAIDFVIASQLVLSLLETPENKPPEDADRKTARELAKALIKATVPHLLDHAQQGEAGAARELQHVLDTLFSSVGPNTSIVSSLLFGSGAATGFDSARTFIGGVAPALFPHCNEKLMSSLVAICFSDSATVEESLALLAQQAQQHHISAVIVVKEILARPALSEGCLDGLAKQLTLENAEPALEALLQANLLVLSRPLTVSAAIIPKLKDYVTGTLKTLFSTGETFKIMQSLDVAELHTGPAVSAAVAACLTPLLNEVLSTIAGRQHETASDSLIKLAALLIDLLSAQDAVLDTVAAALASSLQQLFQQILGAHDAAGEQAAYTVTKGMIGGLEHLSADAAWLILPAIEEATKTLLERSPANNIVVDMAQLADGAALFFPDAPDFLPQCSSLEASAYVHASDCVSRALSLLASKHPQEEESNLAERAAACYSAVLVAEHACNLVINAVDIRNHAALSHVAVSIHDRLANMLDQTDPNELKCQCRAVVDRLCRDDALKSSANLAGWMSGIRTMLAALSHHTSPEDIAAFIAQLLGTLTEPIKGKEPAVVFEQPWVASLFCALFTFVQYFEVITPDIREAAQPTVHVLLDLLGEEGDEESLAVRSTALACCVTYAEACMTSSRRASSSAASHQRSTAATDAGRKAEERAEQMRQALGSVSNDLWISTLKPCLDALLRWREEDDVLALDEDAFDELAGPQLAERLAAALASSKLFSVLLRTAAGRLDTISLDMILCSPASWMLCPAPTEMPAPLCASHIRALAGRALDVAADAAELVARVSHLSQAAVPEHIRTACDEWKKFHLQTVGEAVPHTLRMLVSAISSQEDEVRSITDKADEVGTIVSSSARQIAVQLASMLPSVGRFMPIDQSEAVEDIESDIGQVSDEEEEESIGDEKIRLSDCVALLRVPYEEMQTVGYVCIEQLLLRGFDALSQLVCTGVRGSSLSHEDDVPPKLRKDVLELVDQCQLTSTEVDEVLTRPLNLRSYFLAWCALSHLLRRQTSDEARVALAQHVVDRPGTLESLFRALLNGPLDVAGSGADSDISASVQPSFVVSSTHADAQGMLQLASHTLFLVLAAMPAACRDQYELCNRAQAQRLGDIVASHMAPLLLKNELERVRAFGRQQAASTAPSAGDGDDDGSVTSELSVRVRGSEVVARYTIDQIAMELIIRPSAMHPLRKVEVLGTREVGVSAAQWRSWLIQLMAFLHAQNGGMLDAVQLWAKSIDRKFAGVEECPICYSVLHATTHRMPRLKCRTCRHLFHSACLYKWFSSSGQSTCPLCRNIF